MVNKLLSQIVSVEIYTPKLAESLWFFKEILGLYEVGRKGNSVYLRAWNDILIPYSIKLTEANLNGIGEITIRTMSEADLREAVNIIERQGIRGIWLEEDFGIGRGYVFESPSGHTFRVFWDMKKYIAPDQFKSPLKVRPMKISNKGIGVASFDHVALQGSNERVNRSFFESLSFKSHELVYNDQIEIGAFISITGKAHDIVFFQDMQNIEGRLNHVALNIEHTADIFTAADMYKDYGLEIVSGPLRHGITQGYGLYVKEPGGNVIEVHTGQYYNYLPDWEPVIWDVKKDFWGVGANYYGLITEYLMKGTPEPGLQPIKPLSLKSKK